MFHASLASARRRALALIATSAILTAFAAAPPADAATDTPPTISGTPPTTAIVGTTYVFAPTAADPDGQKLTYTIANKPAWMWFSAKTGKLSGTPKKAQAGRTFPAIRISVSDGVATTSLPAFSITVGTGSGTTNRAPTISGTPVTTAKIASPYAWKPTATDADGDALTFSVTGKPAWASFDTSNGTLYGTPGAAHAGTYPNIVIKASDGKATSSLPAFAITVSATATKSVTLTWTKPTTNVDGSALTDLSGYIVSYGSTSGAYSTSLPLTGASTTSVTVEGLGTGTWYFAIKSKSATGVESEYSGEVVAVL
jgi:hypothetical protein